MQYNKAFKLKSMMISQLDKTFCDMEGLVMSISEKEHQKRLNFIIKVLWIKK